MPQNRRTFLASIGAAVLGSSCARFGFAASAAARPSAGLQLYTIRNLMREDVDRTLADVAAIGYREVEFAGYFGRTPQQIRAALAANGLTSPSTHIGLPEISADVAKAIDDAKTRGHEFLTVPSLDRANSGTADNLKRTAEAFNRIGAEAKKAGLRVGFHNHDAELRPLPDGRMPLDVLLTQTDPSLVAFELDIYWAVKAGADPIAYFTRYPGRFVMTHVKDSSGPPDHRMVEVGAGTIDFQRILSAAESAGALHHFVEHDQPADARASIVASYTHLASVLRQPRAGGN
jgi:sugar phosphate isomerase/epimerase